MPDDRYTIHQARRAAGLSRHQLEQWINRGYVKVKDTPEPGTARIFTGMEVIRISVLAEFCRLGFDAQHVARYCHYVTLRKYVAVLVIWQGPVQLIQTSPRGTSSPQRDSGKWVYNPNDPPMRSDIVRSENIPELLLDPHKRALAMVNLNHVEQRVKKALAEKASD